MGSTPNYSTTNPYEKEPVIKALVKGLVHRQAAVGPAAYKSVVNAGIITVNWKDIQPTAYGPLVTNFIDTELTKAKNLGQKCKLKIYAGQHAPTWVMNLAGGPVCMYDPPSTRTCYNIPRWWTYDVLSAYEDMLYKVAEKYENDPAITTLQASLTGTLFAEPFIRQAIEVKNRQRLLAAGFTIVKDKDAIINMILAHNDRFPTTRMDLALHPYQRIESDGKYGGQDQDYTRSVMEYAREIMGEKCAFGYTAHGKEVEPDSAEERLYDDMVALGGPIWLQTATLEKLGGSCSDLKSTLQWAVDLGAYEVELPAGYQNKCNVNALKPFASALEANANM